MRIVARLGSIARARRAVLCLALTVSSCGGGGGLLGASPNYVNLDSVGSPSSVARGDAHDGVTVQRQAAADFGCALASVTVRGNSPTSATDVYRAEGCGRHGIYVAVYLWGTTPTMPGDVAVLRRYVPVMLDPTAAIATFEADAAGLQLSPEGGVSIASALHRQLLDEWVSLLHAGSTQLECPAEVLNVDVVQQFRGPNTYLADGCGWRAQFVHDSAGRLVMTSRVAIPPSQ